MSDQDDPFVENEIGEIAPCDCGGVNLTMGAMTLHIAREELPLLHDLVSAGLDMVEDTPATPENPPGRPNPDRNWH